MDFWRKLFSEPGTLLVLVSSALIGFVAGVANGVIRHGGWVGFLSSLSTGIVVAVVVGLAVQDYIHYESLRLAIVGVCAIISDDIFTGLKTFGAGLRNDPLGAISRLIDALRGKTVPPAPDNEEARGNP